MMEKAFTRRDPFLVLEGEENFSRFLRPQLDLTGASPLEITNFFSAFLTTNIELSPENLESILEKGLLMGKLDPTEIEGKVAKLPKDLVYVFTKFLLDNPHKEGMGMLVNFCLGKMDEESAHEMRQYGLATSPEAALLVCGTPEVFAHFLQETPSVARVNEYVQFLVQCASRFNKPFYVDTLRSFVEQLEAGVNHSSQEKPISLTPCLLPYTAALRGLGVRFSTVRAAHSQSFFTHFYSRPSTLPQSSVHIPPNYTHANREREVFGEILYENGKGPDHLNIAVHFGMVAGFAKNLDRLRVTPVYINNYVESCLNSDQPFFEYPQAVAQLMTYLRELRQEEAFVTLLREHLGGSSYHQSSFLKHFEGYEKILGESSESLIREWFEKNPAVFATRPDLVIRYRLAPAEQAVRMLAPSVAGDQFNDFVGGVAKMSTQESYHEVEQRLLEMCPKVFAQQTPKVLAQLNDDLVLKGFVRAAEDMRDTKLITYFAERFSFPTLIQHLVDGGVSLDVMMVRFLLAEYADDSDTAYFIKKYGSHVLDRDGVLADRVSSISVVDALPYYQALLHEGHYTRLLNAYLIACEKKSTSREHTDLIWSLLMREVKHNSALYVEVVLAVYSEGAETVEEHFTQFETISPENALPYLLQHPSLLFASEIKNFVQDVGGDFEKRIKELQEEFSPLDEAKVREDDVITPHMSLRTNVLHTLPLVKVFLEAGFSDDQYYKNVYVTMRTPLIEQFCKSGGVIPTHEFTPEFVRQCYLLLHIRKAGLAQEPITDFQKLQAEITRRFEQEFREKFHTTPHGEVEPEYAESLFMYLSYADTHHDKRPELSAATKRYAPFIFQSSYAEWKMFGVTHVPSHEESVRAFEKLRATRMVPPRCTFEQYEAWVKTENVSQNELFEQDLSALRASLVNLFENAVVDGHLPAEALRFTEMDREKHDVLRDQLRSLKEGERKLRGGHLQERDMPLTAHRALEDITRELAKFRDVHQKELQKLTAQLYIRQLQNLSVNEIELDSLEISSHKITFSQVMQSISKEYGVNMAATLSTARSYIAYFKEELSHKGTRSRRVLSGTDAVDLSTCMRIGEKPCSSCQNVFDTNSTGLLSVIVDPHVKVAQVYAQGSIVGRAILRLMSTPEGEPALFLERIYKSHVSSQVDELLYEIARKKARDMGVAVYRHDRSGVANVSLGQYNSRSPYTYSDSVGDLYGSIIAGRSFRISQHMKELT